MATFRKRNGKWQAIVRHKDIGTRARSFHTKQAAIKWVISVEEQLEAGTFGTLRPTHITLGELLERYSREVTPAKRGASTELRRLHRLISDPVSGFRASQLTSHCCLQRPEAPRWTTHLPLRPHPDQTLPQDSDERVGVDDVVQSSRQGEDANFVTNAEPATRRR